METKSDFMEGGQWAWTLQGEWNWLSGERGVGDGVGSSRSMEAMVGEGYRDELKGRRNLLGGF